MVQGRQMVSALPQSTNARDLPVNVKRTDQAPFSVNNQGAPGTPVSSGKVATYAAALQRNLYATRQQQRPYANLLTAVAALSHAKACAGSHCRQP